MLRTTILKGQVTGPNTIHVDEPLPAGATEVQIVVRIPDERAGDPARLLEFLKSLPPGTRTKKDIDRQIDEARGDWDR